MNTRQALELSREIEPDVLTITIETQRKQLADHLHIADAARLQEDLETWATNARFAADIARALNDNLEMKEMRLSDLSQFTAEALVAQALKEALAGDKNAAKAINAAHKRLNTKKVGAANVRN